MNQSGQSDQYLLFRSGSCVGALALRDVREVMRPLAVQAISGAPAFVMGIAILRGTPSPVIDAARLLNDAAVTDPGRFIALKVGSRSACLAVDAVLDVRAIPEDILHPAPALLRDSGMALMPLLGALDRELLLVLNSARMVPDAVWNSMQGIASHL